MKEVYQNKGKKKLKVKRTNTTTGEVCSEIQEIENCYIKYPQRGFIGVYMNSLKNIVDLSKPAQKLLFEIIEHTDNYNIIRTKWKDIGRELGYNQQFTSKVKKELEEAEFISKYKRRYMLNPFIILPAKEPGSDGENKWESQQIWKHLFVDKDKGYFEGIYDVINNIFR